MAASRKAKPRGKARARASSVGVGRGDDPLVAAGARGQKGAQEEEDELSSSMTREVEVPFLGGIVDAAREPSAVPPAPTTRVLDGLDAHDLLDDLAQTMEAPSASPVILLDAAETVLSELGFRDTTDEEVARAAGVSLDVFHAHFASKAALLHAVSDRLCGQLDAVTSEATRTGIWETATPREIVELAIRSMLDVLLARAGLVRAILVSGDETMMDALRQVRAKMAANVLRLVGDARGDKPDQRDVAFALLLAISITHHAVVAGTEWCGLDLEHAELRERIVRAATQCLGDPAR